MLLYRYSNHRKFWLLILTILPVSLQNVVLAYIVQTATNFASQKRWNDLPQFLIICLLAWIFILINNLIFNRLNTDLIKETNINLRLKALKGMLIKEPAQKDQNLGFLTNDFKLLETNRFDAQIDLSLQATNLIMALTYSLLVNWMLTLVFFLATILPMTVSSLFQKPVQKASKSWTKANKNYVEQTQNFLAGASTFHLYHCERQAMKKNRLSVLPLGQALQKMNRLNLDTNSWLTIISMSCSFLLPFLLGIWLVIQEQTTLGALFAIAQLSNSFINPIVTMLSDRNKLPTTKNIVSKLKKYLAVPEKRAIVKSPNFHSLQFTDISSERNQQTLISHLSFKIGEGDKIAIIGPSGIGKTTLFQFLLTGNFGTAKTIKLNQKE